MYIYFKFYILMILFIYTHICVCVCVYIYIYIYKISLKTFSPKIYTFQKRVNVTKKKKEGNQTVPESFVILPKIKKCMTGFLFPANAATYRLLKSYWDECEPTNSKNKSDL